MAIFNLVRRAANRITRDMPNGFMSAFAPVNWRAERMRSGFTLKHLKELSNSLKRKPKSMAL
jgi:hypothetical protein